MADVPRAPLIIGTPQRPPERTFTLYRADVPPNAPSVIFPPGAQSFLPPQRYPFEPTNTSRGTPKELMPDDTISVPNMYLLSNAMGYGGNIQDTTRGTPLTLIPLTSGPLPPGQASFVSTPQHPWNAVNTSMRAFPTTQPPPPPQAPTTGNFHSWYVGKVGIRTKISQNSQVDSDVGDTGGT